MFDIIQIKKIHSNFKIYYVDTSSGKHWLFFNRNKILLHFDDVNFERFAENEIIPRNIKPLRVFAFTYEDFKDYQKIKHLM